MKDFEKIVEGLKWCAEESCEGCPYESMEDGCYILKSDAIKLIEEMKAQLEQPTTACDYELVAQSHSEEIRKLNDELCRVNVEYERTQRELYEAQKELATLRVIKATAEAFLGVKIDGQM